MLHTWRATLHQGARKPHLHFNAPGPGTKKSWERAAAQWRRSTAPKEVPSGVKGKQPPSTPWQGRADPGARHLRRTTRTLRPHGGPDFDRAGD